MNNELLEYRHITKKFGSLTALCDITFSVGRGRILGLLGPNGSGKSTLIKLTNGLLVPDGGNISINGIPVGPETKGMVSYLPERTYLNSWMKVNQLIDMFHDFYSDFDTHKAYEMLKRLNIDSGRSLKTMSKGTKEKVQLILVMSRDADLYILDEPIGGVDPAARDYILDTIIKNYSEHSSVIISTHLISDIEQILDDVIFIKNGYLVLSSSVDDIRMKEGKSIDSLFREVFRC